MPRQLLRTFTLALACAGAACSCVEAAEPYVVTGKTVAVQDGDTITVLDSANVQHKIRLAEIDAPELKQPYGQDAKATLSSLVFGKKVTVTVASKDRYQRELGNVVVGKIDVNGTMVKMGLCPRLHGVQTSRDSIGLRTRSPRGRPWFVGGPKGDHLAVALAERIEAVTALQLVLIGGFVVSNLGTALAFYVRGYKRGQRDRDSLWL